MSEYVNSLADAEKRLYNEKLRIIKGTDPYIIKENDWQTTLDKFPDITYPDIVNYLVLATSTYTMKDFQAYKNLDAYNFFACGWVRNVRTKKIKELHIIISHVMDSPSLQDQPVMPWIVSSQDGTIEAAHCTCFAGLTECCSHIAALLFYVEHDVRMREAQTDTVERDYGPTTLTNEVKYARIADIDFSDAKTRNRKSVREPKAKQRKSEKETKKIFSEPSDKELSHLFLELDKCDNKPAIFAIIPDYSKAFQQSSDKRQSTSK